MLFASLGMRCSLWWLAPALFIFIQLTLLQLANDEDGQFAVVTREITPISHRRIFAVAFAICPLSKKI